MVTYYVGADVDCKMTELVVQRGPDIVMRDRVPTDIRSLRNSLENVPRRKVLLIEECDLAGRLYRNLPPHVDRFIVGDPRRNRAVYDGGDKTDPLDALELAALGRGGYVREVYHTLDEGRLALKRIASGTDKHGRPNAGRLRQWRPEGNPQALNGPGRFATSRGSSWAPSPQPGSSE